MPKAIICRVCGHRPFHTRTFTVNTRLYHCSNAACVFHTLWLHLAKWNEANKPFDITESMLDAAAEELAAFLRQEGQAIEQPEAKKRIRAAAERMLRMSAPFA